MESTETLKKIHESAKKHFLANGFQRASLRKIVSDAGFTLGAFYGYYDSKEELFHALVEQTANGILTALTEMAATLNALPDDQKLAKMTEVFSEGMARLVDYLWEYRDETRLLLQCADGTRYEDFLSEMMEQDILFMAQAGGRLELPMEPLAQKLLVRSYFSVLGQAVLEGNTREEILKTMEDIQAVFTNGMVQILQRDYGEERKSLQ
ncbi:MAG: TetR/AcrR family transcriptional regulator [Lachnospiraceae bacterium]|nr:TetR/AcrR family transcriptional regulator [Lachnospiraceae bacterium]